eukprot:Polyplicarium_translucidae@DN2848_c0_g1_i6.p4
MQALNWEGLARVMGVQVIRPDSLIVQVPISMVGHYAPPDACIGAAAFAWCRAQRSRLQPMSKVANLHEARAAWMRRKNVTIDDLLSIKQTRRGWLLSFV